MSPFDLARSLLGPHAVLLPVKQGTKAVVLKGWPEFSLLDTAAPDYQKRLHQAPAIAASLGPPSRDLIAIDFDDDDAAAEFMALNSALVESLRTRGARGCALWVIMAGPYPEAVKPFTDEAKNKLGEWRGGRCYSLITGQHPEGHLYTVLKQAPPTVATFESIHWPESWLNTPTVTPSEMERPGYSSGYRSDQGNTPKRTRKPAHTLERDEDEDEKRERQQNPAGTIQKTASSIGYHKDALTTAEGSPETQRQSQINKLFERFIEEVWTPSPGKRNEFIVKAVPFLFTAMSEPAVTTLVMRYYDHNHRLFKDSRETHQAEASAHLHNVSARYRQTLKQRERQFYDACPTEKRKAAFRICRHLSKRQSNRSNCGEGDFFLSYADIGARLLIDPKGARKLMDSLVRDKVVEIVQKGERWEKGRRAKATWWRYLF